MAGKGELRWGLSEQALHFVLRPGLGQRWKENFAWLREELVMAPRLALLLALMHLQDMWGLVELNLSLELLVSFGE